MTIRESVIETKVSTYAKSKGWLVYKFVAPGRSGVPDRLYIKEGQVIFIEFKTAKGKLSKLQEVQIERIRQQGIPVYVINNIEAGKTLFDQS